MKTILISTLLIALFSSCKNENLVGTYQSPNYNYLERYLIHAKKGAIAGGITLTLYSDSTYFHKGCTTSTGTWSIENDSLKLIMKTRVWTNDSIQETGWHGKWPEVKLEAEKYQLKNNFLLLEVPDTIRKHINFISRSLDKTSLNTE